MLCKMLCYFFLLKFSSQFNIRGKPEDPSPCHPTKMNKKFYQRKHNSVSKDCLLWNYKDGETVQDYLNEIGHKHVYTDTSKGDCFYGSILKGITCPENYTPQHLQLQICMYMIDNPRITNQLLKQRFQADTTCLYEYILKYSQAGEWGEDCMLKIVHRMWDINITLITVHLPNEPLIHYSHSSSFLDSDVVIIYNGTGHYTGTGNPFFFNFFARLSNAYSTVNKRLLLNTFTIRLRFRNCTLTESNEINSN